jgi:plasmid stabilization system protein ParE
MEVRWTRSALEDLNEIEEYIAQDSYERAVNFINEIIELGDSLDLNWNRGTLAKWTSDKRIRELYYENYTLIYEILDEEVQIHEVHNRAKMIRHFNR